MQKIFPSYTDIAEHALNALTDKQDSMQKKFTIATGLVAANAAIYAGLPVLYYKAYKALGYSEVLSQTYPVISIETSLFAAAGFAGYLKLVSGTKEPSQKPFSLRATFLSLALTGAVASALPQVAMTPVLLLETAFPPKPVPQGQSTLDQTNLSVLAPNFLT